MEQEPPAIPCIACMERDAVIISLFCGHLSFFFSGFAVYEEGVVEAALFVGNECYVFSDLLLKFYLCFFVYVFLQKN